jgi:hypothetical protein
VVFHRLAAPDRAVFDFTVRLPWGARLFARHVYRDVSARAFMLSADRRTLHVVGGDGAISDVDLTTGGLTDTPVLGSQNEVASPFASPESHDDPRLYVGVGSRDQGLSREIRVFDTNTWARVGTIRTSTPFLTAVAARDGSTIYAMTGERSRVLVIDSVAQREVRAMLLGRVPSLALLAP